MAPARRPVRPSRVARSPSATRRSRAAQQTLAPNTPCRRDARRYPSRVCPGDLHQPGHQRRGRWRRHGDLYARLGWHVRPRQHDGHVRHNRRLHQTRHADETRVATRRASALVTYTNPATSDAVDGAGTATCTPVSGGTFALGNTTVTCGTTDACTKHAMPTRRASLPVARLPW